MTVDILVDIYFLWVSVLYCILGIKEQGMRDEEMGGNRVEKWEYTLK